MITYLYKNLVAFDLQHAGALIDDFVLEQRQLVPFATGNLRNIRCGNIHNIECLLLILWLYADAFWMMRFKVTIFINAFIYQIKFC